MVRYDSNNLKELRESKNWSQEEVAKKLHISKNGYAKIEHGESRINMERLKQIADVFGVDVVKLMECQDDKDKSTGIICLIGDSSVNNNYFGDSLSEIERLKLIINHKDELLKKEQKDNARLEKELARLVKDIMKKDEQIDALMKKLTD